MHWETIGKDTTSVVPPRLADYGRARSDFTWAQARTELAGLPDGGINMAHEAVDLHAASEHADKAALRCVARDDSVSTVTYAELARRTARFGRFPRGRRSVPRPGGATAVGVAAPQARAHRVR